MIGSQEDLSADEILEIKEAERLAAYSEIYDEAEADESELYFLQESSLVDSYGDASSNAAMKMTKQKKDRRRKSGINVFVIFGFTDNTREVPTTYSKTGHRRIFYGTAITGKQFIRMFGDSIQKYFKLARFDAWKQEIKERAKKRSKAPLEEMARTIRSDILESWKSGLLYPKSVSQKTVERRAKFGIIGEAFGWATGQIASFLYVRIVRKRRMTSTTRTIVRAPGYEEGLYETKNSFAEGNKNGIVISTGYLAMQHNFSKGYQPYGNMEGQILTVAKDYSQENSLEEFVKWFGSSAFKNAIRQHDSQRQDAITYVKRVANLIKKRKGAEAARRFIERMKRFFTAAEWSAENARVRDEAAKRRAAREKKKQDEWNKAADEASAQSNFASGTHSDFRTWEQASKDYSDLNANASHNVNDEPCQF